MVGQITSGEIPTETGMRAKVLEFEAVRRLAPAAIVLSAVLPDVLSRGVHSWRTPLVDEAMEKILEAQKPQYGELRKEQT